MPYLKQKTFLFLTLFNTLFSAFLLGPGALAQAAELRIDDVIDWVQNRGFAQKELELEYQKSEIPNLLFEAQFDTQIYLRGQNEDSRMVSPGAPLWNLRDQSDVFALNVSRKYLTGSTLGIEYSYLHRDSILSPTLAQLGAPSTQYYQLATLNFKQDLLNNSFGLRDRLLKEAHTIGRQRARFETDEATEELVLQTIRLYLDAYFAQENLKQSMAARDKYLLLVKSLRQKSRMGFDDRSELVKAQAELQNQERNVSSAQLMHTNLLDRLYTLMNTPRPKEINIQLPALTPPPPLPQSSASLESLRKVKASELKVQSAEAEKEAAENSQRVSLNFFGQALFGGIGVTNDEAATKVRNRDHPKYIFGLELMAQWGGSAQKAELLTKKVAYSEATNQKHKIAADLAEAIERTDRDLRSKYQIAANAQETVKIWEEALKSQERNHRYGRITTAELIMDYGSYFRAKATLSGSLAEYQLALYEFKATRDELIQSKN